MDNHTIKTIFKKYIYPLDSNVLQKMIDYADVDKYVKKLDTLTFTRLFIYAQLKGLQSLRRISENVKHKKVAKKYRHQKH